MGSTLSYDCKIEADTPLLFLKFNSFDPGRLNKVLQVGQAVGEAAVAIGEEAVDAAVAIKESRVSTQSDDESIHSI